MQNDYIDVLEVAPEIKSNKCKIISFLIQIFLQFTTVVVGIIVWFIYDYFIAIATLLLTFIIMGIIRSKIANSVIPPQQREHQYSDKEIANWFTSKDVCIELNDL